jgi:hypothetical protein
MGSKVKTFFKRANICFSAAIAYIGCLQQFFAGIRNVPFTVDVAKTAASAEFLFTKSFTRITDLCSRTGIANGTVIVAKAFSASSPDRDVSFYFSAYCGPVLLQSSGYFSQIMFIVEHMFDHLTIFQSKVFPAHVYPPFPAGMQVI